jgi:RNA polymerase sigma-70 factor (ECF subfamily)
MKAPSAPPVPLDRSALRGTSGPETVGPMAPVGRTLPFAELRWSLQCVGELHHQPMDSGLAQHDPFPEWTRRLVASDHAALQSLFEATHDALLSYAQRMIVDESAAMDMVQIAFIRLWQHRTELDPARPVRAWLYRTVRNLVLTRLRDERTHARHLNEWDDAPQWRDPGPEALLEEKELARSLEGWMAELPDRQREALMLSRFEGLSHEEIADVMGIAPRTVNNHLVRGLRFLRERFDATQQQEAI